MKNVVVIGGGTGLSVMLRGMKQIENIDLTAIVTVADDRGKHRADPTSVSYPCHGGYTQCHVRHGGGGEYLYVSYELSI